MGGGFEELNVIRSVEIHTVVADSVSLSSPIMLTIRTRSCLKVYRK